VVKGGDLFGRFAKEDNAEARKLFKRASEIDPGYALALTMVAWTHFIDAWLGYSESRTESIRRAVELAKKSGSIDDTQPAVHSLWSSIHLTRGQYEKAISAGKKAIALGPNSAICHVLLAYTMNLAGRFEEAIVLAEKAIRLMPYCPDWFLWILAQSYRQAGRYGEALSVYKKALDRAQKNKEIFMGSTIGLVDVSMQLGRVEEGRTYAAELLKIMPNFSLEGFRKVYAYKDPAHLERILVNLRKAGLPETPPLPLPDKPSIAVLPFVNMSGDPEQEYFSDGITEEIITALSKTPKLFVIARNSTFTYKAKPVKVQRVGRELGVKYVLEGSVRKAEDKVRITAQLVDTKTGNHLWAERYDRDLKDIFAVQDEITKKIITALQVELTEGERVRGYARGTDNLEAYLKFLQGSEHYRRFNKEDNAKARKIYEEAIALDPEYPEAYTMLGWTHWIDLWLKSSRSPRESIRQAFELAQKSIALDSSCQHAHLLLSNLYLITRKHEKAIAEGEKAIALDPNSADAYAMYGGQVLVFSGKPEEGVLFVEKAIRLNPIAPSYYLHMLGMAYRETGRYEDSITACKKAIKRQPNNIFARLILVATYSMLGREDAARATAAEVLRIDPKFSVEHFAKTRPHIDPANTARFADALRNAGLK
jgi:adenylate cyclase